MQNTENEGERQVSLEDMKVESLDRHCDVWEKWVKPSTPDQPLMRVRENTPGHFEAICALGLTGIANGRETGNEGRERVEAKVEKNGRQYLSLLTEGLVAGQQMDLIYSCCHDSGTGERFDWKIVNSATGDSPEAAVVRLTELWQNLAVILTMEKDYLFAPVITTEEVERTKVRGAWRGTIRPTGVAIPGAGRNPMGFSLQRQPLHSQAGTVLVSPMAPIVRKSLDSVVVGALGYPASVRVVVSISPFSLSVGNLQKAARALEWLRKGEAKGIRYHGDLEEALEEVEVLNRVKCNLELWVKNPQGYKITCSVLADKPIPSAFLNMVGSELFNGRTVRIQTGMGDGEVGVHGEYHEPHSADILDLTDCINSASDLPPLFPSISKLTEAGIRRFYSFPQTNLPKSGLFLGRAGDGKTEMDVRFQQPDRSRHCYIVGATGTGKSNLLFNMITQDIENGEGVALIDPHGDLYEQVLKSIPSRRIQDVVLVNPCDFDHPVGINFLEHPGPNKPAQINFIVNEMMKIFGRLYDLRIAGGPLFEQYMRNALLLLMTGDFPATLMDVPMLFEDKEFRSFLKERCKNPLVQSFWTKIAEKAGGEISLANMAPYITSKLNLFTANGLLSPIIGQPRSTINFREVMDRGKILLVNLSKGILGELDVQLLGLLLIGKTFSGAMSRVDLPPEARRPFYLYIDEFQNFTTDTVAFLLSEARKFGLYLALANQNLAQLSANDGKQNLLDAVLGNVGTVLVFRLGAIDAEKIQVYTKPELQARDLQDLPDYHVAARLLSGNCPSRAFVFKTLPASRKTDTDPTKVICASRRKYTRSRRLVEREIIKRRTSYSELPNCQVLPLVGARTK